MDKISKLIEPKPFKICGVWKSHLIPVNIERPYLSDILTFNYLSKGKKMVNEISDESEIQAPAAKVWEVYGGSDFAEFLQVHLPEIVEKIDVLEGNGGEGTLLHVTFAAGLGGMRYKEKLVKVDNEKRLKIAKMVEGGYLDLGFTLYQFCFQVIEKDEESCIVKSSVQYELKEEAASNISLVSVQPLIAIAQAVKNYFLNNSQKPKDDA